MLLRTSPKVLHAQTLHAMGPYHIGSGPAGGKVKNFQALSHEAQAQRPGSRGSSTSRTEQPAAPPLVRPPAGPHQAAPACRTRRPRFAERSAGPCP